MESILLDLPTRKEWFVM